MSPRSSFRLKLLTPMHNEAASSSSNDSFPESSGLNDPLHSSAEAYPVPAWKRPARWVRMHRSPICLVLTILIILQLLVIVVILGVNLAIARTVKARLTIPPSDNGVSRYLASLQANKVPRDEIFTNATLLHKFLDQSFTRDIAPLPCHSHNDYQRNVPLYDALNAGCASVEADIWVDPNNSSDLLVGHKRNALSPVRTLNNMYINPIVSILDSMNKNNTGALSGPFETSPNTTLVLLLDFKMAADVLWPLVQAHLTPLRERSYLQHWNETTQKIVAGPVTIVASGEADKQPQLIQSSTSNPRQDLFLDAPLASLTSTTNPAAAYNVSNSYYASTSLSIALGPDSFRPSLFTLPDRHNVFSTSQSTRLRNQTQTAQSMGLKARYWSTPGWPVGTRNAVWSGLMYGIGVDVLNVDDVWGAARWDWRACLVGWIGIC